MGSTMCCMRSQSRLDLVKKRSSSFAELALKSILGALQDDFIGVGVLPQKQL